MEENQNRQQTENVENQVAPEKIENTVDIEVEDNRPPRPFLYRFRGVVLAILAIGALVLPAGDLEVVPFLVFVNLFIIAVYLRVKARRAIGEHSRGSVQDAPVLITWGAYGRMRHPLYVSNMTIGLSLIVLHFGIDWFVIPFAVVLIAIGLRLAKLDDRYLEQRYGDEWKLWAMHTPAFIPREIHIAGPLRSGKDAFIADMVTWVWLALMVALVLFRKVDFILWA